MDGQSQAEDLTPQMDEERNLSMKQGSSPHQQIEDWIIDPYSPLACVDNTSMLCYLPSPISLHMLCKSFDQLLIHVGQYHHNQRTLVYAYIMYT